MKKLYNTILVLFILIVIPFTSDAQCKHFAKQVCIKELSPYIHDGNYNAAILTEGESAEMYKTFYSGQNYRIFICGSGNLPNVQFQVLDVNRNVLYDNSSNDYNEKWDFIPQTSQQLIISLQVGSESNSEAEAEPVSGCVAIMIGIKESSD